MAKPRHLRDTLCQELCIYRDGFMAPSIRCGFTCVFLGQVFAIFVVH